MSISNWDMWCWAAGVLGFLTLATVLFLRKRYKTFPWFTGLLVFEIFQTAVLFLVHRFGGDDAYFYTFWGGEVVEALLRIGVVYELAKIASRHIQVPSRRFVWATTGSLIVAVAACAYILRMQDTIDYSIIGLATKVSICSSILGGFTALMVFVMVNFEGIKVRVHSQAVTYGLVLYFLGKLIGNIVLLTGDEGWWFAFQNGLKPLYIVCLFAWAAAFWFDEPRQVLNDEMDRYRRLRQITSAFL